MTDTTYLLLRNGRFYYFRRVPGYLRKFDKRTFIKVALKTDSRNIAATKARMMNAEIEAYWRNLIDEGETHTGHKFKQTIELARHLGFTYLPHNQLIQNTPVKELTQRLDKIEKAALNERHTEALWGGADEPDILLGNAFSIFLKYTKDRTLKKDEKQLRKWENPRKKAIRNLIAVVGDKNIKTFDRDDLILFRNWWINRIENDGYVGATANKDLVHVKSIIETVCENLKIRIDKAHIFNKLTLDESDSRKRPAFETKHILDCLLVDPCLEELDEDERWFIFAMADTGARDSELVMLTEKKIVLDHAIPHIFIDAGKTPYSVRKIPLVGFALDAFKARPKGFGRYYNKADELSTSLNKHLRRNGLFPSEMHSLYSLRHSFQDRILAVDAPDRIQAELMGHRFNRPSYGDGPTLAHKLAWMKKIQLRGE